MSIDTSREAIERLLAALKDEATMLDAIREDGMSTLLSNGTLDRLRLGLRAAYVVMDTLGADRDQLRAEVQGFQQDTEWRHRWHARLSREQTETEGRFYERIERNMSELRADVERLTTENLSLQSVAVFERTAREQAEARAYEREVWEREVEWIEREWEWWFGGGHLDRALAEVWRARLPPWRAYARRKLAELEAES